MSLGLGLVFVRLGRHCVFFWFSLDYLWPPYVIGGHNIFALWLLSFFYGRPM